VVVEVMHINVYHQLSILNVLLVIMLLLLIQQLVHNILLLVLLMQQHKVKLLQLKYQHVVLDIS